MCTRTCVRGALSLGFCRHLYCEVQGRTVPRPHSGSLGRARPLSSGCQRRGSMGEREELHDGGQGASLFAGGGSGRGLLRGWRHWDVVHCGQRYSPASPAPAFGPQHHASDGVLLTARPAAPNCAPTLQVSPATRCTSAGRPAASRRHGARSGSECSPTERSKRHGSTVSKDGGAARVDGDRWCCFGRPAAAAARRPPTRALRPSRAAGLSSAARRR